MNRNFRVAAFICAINLAVIFGGAQSSTSPTTAPAKTKQQLIQESLQLVYERQLAKIPDVTRWSDIVLAVGRADVVGDIGFHSTMEYWKSGYVVTGDWTKRQGDDLNEPQDFNADATIMIDGNCGADISVRDRAIILILGNLEATVTVGEHSEVIIGGDIGPHGSVVTRGIAGVFIGGNVFGSIVHLDYSTCWVQGDVVGSITTGQSKNEVHVMGDCLGVLGPTHAPLTLHLEVRGFMPTAQLLAIADQHYNQFHASIGISDQPPGIYPKLDADLEIQGRRASSRWVVHRQQQVVDEPASRRP